MLCVGVDGCADLLPGESLGDWGIRCEVLEGIVVDCLSLFGPGRCLSGGGRRQLFSKPLAHHLGGVVLVVHKRKGRQSVLLVAFLFPFLRNEFVFYRRYGRGKDLSEALFDKCL